MCGPGARFPTRVVIVDTWIDGVVEVKTVEARMRSEVRNKSCLQAAGAAGGSTLAGFGNHPPLPSSGWIRVPEVEGTHKSRETGGAIAVGLKYWVLHILRSSMYISIMNRSLCEREKSCKPASRR